MKHFPSVHGTLGQECTEARKEELQRMIANLQREIRDKEVIMFSYQNELDSIESGGAASRLQQ